MVSAQQKQLLVRKNRAQGKHLQRQRVLLVDYFVREAI
jgi:hypothetical protein